MTKCTFCNYQQIIDNVVYCSNCGTRLIADASQAVTSDRLKFWGGELRLLSVFFVNFIGFEKFVERGIHVNAMIYIRECLKDIEQIIKSSDGTSNQIIPDDRILGIFGAPKAHHDDPVRAVRCALSIRDWWLKKKATEEFLEHVDITIGVNTGRAFFGYILEGSSFPTVIGDPINTASRLAEICPPHEIIISENTYEKVRDYVDVESIGEQIVRGRSAKVNVYRLKGIQKESRVTPAPKTPLFGREREFKKLIEVAQGIKENKLSFCIIRGQMGIGKSRLKEAFEDYILKDKSINLIETHCSTEVTSPYYPFRFLLRDYFKLNEFDSKELMTKKIDDIIAIKGLTRMDAKGIKHLFLTDLRRLKSDEVRYINEEIYTSIKNLLKHECQNQPLILIFEEFNKIDSMSKELISYLSFELENVPLMFLVVNISKDFMANISESIEFEEINLTPLSIKAIGELVKFMLNDVDDKLIDFIYRTTGGNPLFAIEAIRHSRRAQIIRQDAGRWVLEKEQRLPFLDDLYGVVMSTIDSLSSEYRLIVDYASVIGYSFAFRILRGLFNRPDLKNQLSYLVQEGYVILSKDDQDPIYIFRHNLLKDAAYTVLPLKKRKALHQQVANLFETIYAGQLSNFYENIAYHYSSCDNFRKAANYFKLAGDRAKNLYAVEQALSFYNTFLKIKKEKEAQVPDDLHREVLLNLTDLYEITGNIQKMEATAYEGLENATKDKNLIDEINFTERSGYAQILLSKFDEAEEVLLLGVQKCDEAMADILAVLYTDLGILYANKYEYEKSILYYNRSWNTAHNNKINEAEILCLLNLSQLHRNLGNYEQAMEYLDHGLENLIAKEDVRRIMQFRYLIADINHQIWHLEKAKEFLSASLQLAEIIGSSEIYIKSALDLALISTNNGNVEETEKYLQLADKKISFFIRENLWAEINLKKALIYYYKNDRVKAQDYILNALRTAEKFKQKEIECHCYKLLSLVDNENNLDHAHRALNIAEMLKSPPMIAEVLYILTQLFGHNNDLEKMQYYGKKALLIYNDLKTKLKDENRQFYSHRPEYVKLLGM